MNHSEHDLDLLASWASGYEPDRRRAEEFMTQCPECAAFFTEQSEVRSVLAAMGTARMRPEEATSLLAAISTAQPLSTALSQRPKPINPVWNRLLGAAAALALVTAIGISLRPIGGAGGDEMPTSAVGGAASESRASDSALEMQAATTLAAETTAAAFGAADMAGDLDSLKAEADALAAEPPEDSASAQRLAFLCPSVDFEILASIETTYQGRETFLILVEDEGSPVVKAYFGDDCTEILLP